MRVRAEIQRPEAKARNPNLDASTGREPEDHCRSGSFHNAPLSGRAGDTAQACRECFGFRFSAFGRTSDFGLRIRARGFTLIEVIISTALMALIIASAYLCLNAAVSSQKMIEPRATVFQNARVAMALIAADLRCACPLSREADFLGMHRTIGTIPADNLDFATHNYTPRRPGEGDFCQESLYLDRDPESGAFVLYRRRNPAMALDPLAGGSREEIARDLLGLRFEYYDGLDWYESWGEVDRRSRDQTSRRERYNLEGMPQAVRVTLWFDSNPKTKPADGSSSAALKVDSTTEELTNAAPLMFQTVAYLNLATASQNAAGGGADTRGGNVSPEANRGVNP